MDGERFDRLARRRALRLAGGGLAGGVLAALGLGRAAVRAQDAPASTPCSQCSRCIAMFRGGCVSNCVAAFEPATCPGACCEGALTVCTVLGECTPTCTVSCPGT